MVHDSPQTRQSLVVRLSDPSDREAWTWFTETYAPLVYRFLRNQGLQDADARDVAQEVFIVALRAAPRFRGDARVSTWLFGITRRVLANARRRAALRRFVGLGQIREPASAARTDEAVIRRFLV